MANTFTSYVNKDVGTSPATVVTVGAGTQTTIIGLSFANTSSSPITADAYITRSGTDYSREGGDRASGQFASRGRRRSEDGANYVRRFKGRHFCCQFSRCHHFRLEHYLRGQQCPT